MRKNGSILNQMKCRTNEELENSKIREEVKFVPVRLKLIEYHQAVYKCPIITGKSQKIRS
ncbi:IS66 family transposase zinc-finger binding domain-containing protein [Ligilactobacillus ruminis]|uniref:IS66 family transposase zinc-finger binding domain-containing protein n=1 Tax=Ligilactobacillus ruminis TaxID=1623 RepID=UPI003A4DF534